MSEKCNCQLIGKINAKKRIQGNINHKKVLKGILNNSVIAIPPLTQEKEAIPNKEVQIIEPDIEYTGLSKVTVQPYTPIVNKKIITQNGVYDAIDDGLDGYNQVEVATNSIGLEEYMQEMDLMITLNINPFYKPNQIYSSKEIELVNELINKLGGI